MGSVDRFTPEQLRDAPVHFLLDFSWGGITVRLAEQTLVGVPIGEKNSPLDYTDGLEIGGTYEDTLHLFQDEPDLRSMGMSLHVAPTMDVRALILEGFNLGTATGVLRVWAEGSSDTITLIDGIFKNPSWDVGDAPLVGTLEENPVEDVNLIPDVNAKVITDTWATIATTDATHGEYYPTIIGQPRGTNTEQYPTPGILVDDTGGSEKALIAGHPVLANQVKVSVPDVWTTVETLTVNHEVDGLGRVVATVDVDNATTGQATAPGLTDEMWVSWTGGGGLASHDPAKALQGAGDVLQYFLERSSIRWDAGRIAPVLLLLNQFKIDTYVLASQDSRITPYHFIQDSLLPILPISVRYGPSGLYFVYWNYFATSEQAVAHIQQDVNADRVAGVETTDLLDVANDYTLSYNFTPRSGGYQSQVHLAGDPNTVSTTSAIPNLYAQRSYFSYGKRASLQDVSQVVRDGATATLIAEWKIRRHSQQFYEVFYDVDQVVAGMIEPGSVILLTDGGRGFDKRVGLVTSILMSGDRSYQVGFSLPSTILGTAQ